MAKKRILADERCTACGKRIRTIAYGDHTIESDYRDAEGRCWECANKKRRGR